MDFKLELVPVPVADVDRAKAFYADQVGFIADHDHAPSEEIRFVQLTPPGSACSIAIGKGIVDSEPGSLIRIFAGADLAGWHVGIRAYRQVRPFAEREEELLHLLDRSGTVVGVINWLLWLCLEERTFADRAGPGELPRLVRAEEVVSAHLVREAAADHFVP